MNWLPSMNGTALYIEIRQSSLRARHGEESLSLRLERQADGRLVPECREKLGRELRAFLKRKNWQPRPRVFCAIDARGVSLRRLKLPAASNEEGQRLLRLQIEREFPLAPDALAWGSCRVEQAATTDGKQELLVAAVKKEVVEDYAQVLSGCAATPLFTVAALARSRVCPSSVDSYALLDIGRQHSELLVFTHRVAESIRILAWGGENITRAIEQKLGISREEAEKLKLEWDNEPTANGDLSKGVRAAMSSALDTLASTLKPIWSGKRLYLTGNSARAKEMPQRLAEKLGADVQCERLELPASEPGSAAILGLAGEEKTGARPLLFLRAPGARANGSAGRGGAWKWPGFATLRAEAREITAQPALRKWARLAVLLGCLALCFPLLETLLLKPILAKKVASVNRERGRLSMIDREMTFLQHLKQGQPPCLDVLYVLADAASPGTRFDAVALSRRGELSLKGNLRDGQQVVDLRSKLLKSGFFSIVTVEEQTPSPDRQKVAIRITALLKPAGARPPLSKEVPTNAPLPEMSSFPFPGMGGGQPMPMSFPGPDAGLRAEPGPGPMPMKPPASTNSARSPGAIVIGGASTPSGATNQLDTNSAAAVKPASADEEKKEEKKE